MLYFRWRKWLKLYNKFYIIRIFCKKSVIYSDFNIYLVHPLYIKIRAVMGFLIKPVFHFFFSSYINKLENFQNSPNFFYMTAPIVDQSAWFRGTRRFYNRSKIYKEWIWLRHVFYDLNSFIINRTRGFKTKLKIKGFGLRAWKTKSLLWFRLGQSHRIMFTFKKTLKISIYKKKTILRIFSNTKQDLLTFAHETIKLKPTFAYKDVGIRLITKRPILKRRRVAAY